VVTVLALLAVVAVLFGTAVLATRADPLLADAPPDRPDLDLPTGALTADDVAGVRFSLALRGYRMAEVDEVLERLAAELADRDRRIAELTGSPEVDLPVEQRAAPSDPILER
jgi:DivIVA domain-containing protein